MQFAMVLVSRKNATGRMSQLLKLTQRQRSEDGLCSFYVNIKNATGRMSQLLKLTQRQRSEDGLCSFHVYIKKV